MPAHPAPTVFLETFGCQMNELDSELVRGALAALGYRFIQDSARADVVLYNTCSVRQQAENKVLSRIGRVGVDKGRGRRVVLGVIGCMAEREGAGLLTRYPQVDLMCGPGELDRLPQLIDNALKTGAVERADRVALAGSKSRRTATLHAAEDNLELLDLSRSFDPDYNESQGRPRRSAYVRITRGCNKFCTYCVVPMTRGAEVHRPPDSIVDECRRLAEAGVIEVTLLGQTVNHYRYVHGAAVTVGGAEAPQVGPGAAAFKAGSGLFFAAKKRPDLFFNRVTTFADLLRRIHDEVPAIRRLRFVTSYPRDFGDDILHVMAASPRICKYMHVPFQSGSDRILGLMNRGYRRDEYLALLERARAIIPGLSIAADIIVGFPTETDDEFAQTIDLLKRARLKNCFIFKYSPRPGTAAMDRSPDDVPEAVKRRRNNEALAAQAAISAEVHAEQEGRVVEVFVEKLSTRKAAAEAASHVRLGWVPVPQGSDHPGAVTQLSGRTDGDLIAVFDLPPGRLPDDFLGEIVPVAVTGSGPLILYGRYAGAVEASAGRVSNASGPVDANCTQVHSGKPFTLS